MELESKLEMYFMYMEKKQIKNEEEKPFSKSIVWNQSGGHHHLNKTD